jgi:D-beta-D-heptose 7-phosphate kinase/D-beta-D-heptose 1-phosphate adenosyltransferase
VFKEKTPFKLIATLKPNVLVKGADWKKSHIVGRNTVESYGGRVARIPLVKGYSTSSFIAKIKKL